MSEPGPTGERQRVGVIGLGAMGKPIAARLLDQGFLVTVAPQRNPSTVKELVRQVALDVETMGELVVVT